MVKLSRKREKVAAYDFAAYDFSRFPATKPLKFENFNLKKYYNMKDLTKMPEPSRLLDRLWKEKEAIIHRKKL